MYERSGYRTIERYNDNPYAEAFFEKALTAGQREDERERGSPQQGHRDRGVRGVCSEAARDFRCWLTPAYPLRPSLAGVIGRELGRSSRSSELVEVVR